MGPALLIRHPRHKFWPGGLSLYNQKGIDPALWGWGHTTDGWRRLTVLLSAGRDVGGAAPRFSQVWTLFSIQ
jgi:hypothetical protein